MTAAEPHEAHVPADGRAGQPDRAFQAGWHDGAGEVQLHELDLDAAIHDERELVVRGREPGRRAFGAQRLDHVLAVLCDDDLLVGQRARGDVEHIRECVALDVIVDDLDVALDVARERAEGGRELADAAPLKAHSSCPPAKRAVCGEYTARGAASPGPGVNDSRHSFRHLDLKHLRQLTEVADKGSIRAAAESLAITQPALSRSIRSIENELGLKLVERGPRGAELTPAGNRLLSYARIIDANMTSAENELRGLRDRSSRTEQIAFGMSWLTEQLIAAQLIGRVLRKRLAFAYRRSSATTSRSRRGSVR